MTVNQYFSETSTNIPSRVDLCARGVGNGAASLTGVKGVTSIVWVSTGKYTVDLAVDSSDIGSVAAGQKVTLTVSSASSSSISAWRCGFP